MRKLALENPRGILPSEGPGGVAGMLYLTRKVGESVIINDAIEVTVVEIRGKSIKLGFEFPSDASVLRKEIYERIQEENRAAAEASANLLDAPPEKGGI